tara:strand:- start:715 stop:1263 length:549 start_codon:yes stop_codon:yes gene_type:complete
MESEGSYFFLITMISAYIFFSQPQFVFGIMPVEIPAIFFGIVALLCFVISMRFWAGTVTKYFCPSCKGVLFDINIFKIVINGKVTKSSVRKHDAILDFLNDSSKISDLQCPICSKGLNIFNVLCKLRHKTSSGLEIAADRYFQGAKQIQVEGCKNCKSLWLDKNTVHDIVGARIVSNVESPE